MGKKSNLIFDIHAYLDREKSGTRRCVYVLMNIFCLVDDATHGLARCVTNNIASAWAPLAQWLSAGQSTARQVMVIQFHAFASCVNKWRSSHKIPMVSLPSIFKGDQR